MRQVAKLVRLVVMAEFQHGGAGHVANSGGGLNVSRMVLGVVAQLLHQRDVHGVRIAGQHIFQRPKCGVTYCPLFVRESSLRSRPPQRSA